MVKFNTLLVRGGKPNDNSTGAVNVPIYNSSTFRYPKLGSDVKWDYERSGNPTRDAVEDVCAELENGDRGFAFSSGMAAITLPWPSLSLVIILLSAITSTVGLSVWLTIS